MCKVHSPPSQFTLVQVVISLHSPIKTHCTSGTQLSTTQLQDRESFYTNCKIPEEGIRKRSVAQSKSSSCPCSELSFPGILNPLSFLKWPGKWLFMSGGAALKKVSPSPCVTPNTFTFDCQCKTKLVVHTINSSVSKFRMVLKIRGATQSKLAPFKWAQNHSNSNKIWS